MMNREQVVTLFRKIKDFYSNFEVNSEKVDSWHSFLRNSNPAIVMRNLEDHILKEKFPPTIAELAEQRNKTNVLDLDETQELLRKMKQWEKEAGRPNE
jgi:hypothetical protein